MNNKLEVEKEGKQCGAYRLGNLRDVGPVGEHVGGVGLGIGLGSHLLDVGARREGLLAASDHDAAYVVVLVECACGVDQVLGTQSDTRRG